MARCTIQKRTVICGGHETFLKQIRKNLDGDIRFIDREQVFPVSLIRHADVVWIQSNAISHKQYNRVMKEARTYRKPIMYFACASAERCAAQLAACDVM